MSKDYYNVLGITKSANKEEIKKAFHKLAHKYHPDKKGGDEAKFKELNEAYQVLSNEKKRSEYDSYGRTFNEGEGPGGFAGQPGGPGGFAGQGGFGGQAGFNPNDYADFDFGNLNDIFSDFFGGGQQRARPERRGRDISTELNITFAESVFGVQRKVLLTKTSVCDTCGGNGAKPGTKMKTCAVCNGKGQFQETRRTILGAINTVRTCEVCAGSGKIPEEFCGTCKGKGVLRKEEELEINVPAGIQDGEIMRFTGRGEAISKGTSGDLYVKINVARHLVFTRRNNDLLMDLTVKLTDALLGAEYSIDTLDGKLKVSIPAGVAPNEVLRVRGKGVSNEHAKRGDLLIKVTINLPQKLSKKSKEYIEKLREEGV